MPESRRARKKDRTRAEIFRAAMDLFGVRGFEAVTVEQICAAADVAKGTFFLHFSSKAALLVEWNRELAAELADRLRDPRDSALLQYRTLVEVLGEHWRRRPDATRALLPRLIGPASPGARRPSATCARWSRRSCGAVRSAASFAATCRRGWRPRRSSPRAPRSSPPKRSRGDTPEAQRNELLHALLHGLSEPKPRLKWTRSP